MDAECRARSGRSPPHAAPALLSRGERRMISVKVDGLSDLANRLKELDVEMQTRLLAASAAAAAATVRKEVELQARAQFTERTGTLFRSIYVKAQEDGERLSGLLLHHRHPEGQAVPQSHAESSAKTKGQTVNMDAFYAGFLEFGTKRMQRHPFMRPAFEAKKMDAVVAAKTACVVACKYGLR